MRVDHDTEDEVPLIPWRIPWRIEIKERRIKSEKLVPD